MLKAQDISIKLNRMIAESEASFHASLKHENIIRLFAYEINENEKKLFMVMEKADRDLEDAMKEF